MRALLALLLLAPGPYGLAQEDAQETPKESVRLFIGFEPGVPYADRYVIVRREGHDLLDNFEELDVFLIALNPQVQKENIKLAMEKLLDYPGVSYVERDSKIEFTGSELDQSKSQNPPKPTWNIKRLNLPKAWEKTKGAGVKVAVLDTGIDSDHPGFIGKIADGYDATSSADGLEDIYGHGTAMAGIIAARLMPDAAISVAPEAQLVIVKVSQDGRGPSSNAIRGIYWVGKNRIPIANISFAFPDCDSMEKREHLDCPTVARALKWATSRGTLFITGAGNTRKEDYLSPCIYKFTLCATSSDLDDVLAQHSSYAGTVDFIAPGEEIYSTRNDRFYSSDSGTSYAAAHLSGLAALAAASGKNGPEEIRAALRKAAKPLGLGKKKEGYGIIDAARLVGAQ